MPLLKCLRCGADWPSKVENPKSCPRCKSYAWNRIRVASLSGGDATNLIYDVTDLAVGQSRKFIFHSRDDGAPDENKNRSMCTSIIQYGKRTAKRFGLMGRGANLIVTRIA